MANLVVHFEIWASEPQRLIDFYSGLFDWRFEQYGDTPYWTIATGDGAINEPGVPGLGINGGLAQREGPAPAPDAPVNGCNVVVSVDDTDAAFARALDLGGRESAPPEDMAGIGRVAYLVDPDGNLFGLISETLSDGSSAMDVG
jgi:predicted enzyme related to lactoylglutathione lyase